KKLFFAALILCATTAVNAQDDTKKAPAANPNAPDISFESETHDFGTIPYSGNGTYEFKFTNTGKEPLV
ncbi:MAG TPA: DUF1573 domain-containing protein, partial [Bacteroidia bacterium]|nr:DUF1573 domain-containing protein [Bacteroidia bacterium]